MFEISKYNIGITYRLHKQPRRLSKAEQRGHENWTEDQVIFIGKWLPIRQLRFSCVYLPVCSSITYFNKTPVVGDKRPQRYVLFDVSKD